MKIFCTSDLHGNLKMYKQLIDYVKDNKVDVLILAGDLLPKSLFLTFDSLLAYQESFANDISNLLSELDIPIYYILGNDDWFEAELLPAINISGKVIDYEGIYITGFEKVLTTPFHTNRESTETELEYLFKKQISDLDIVNKSPLIIVGHTPLHNANDKIMRGSHVGSKLLKKAIQDIKPMAYICGHIHEDYGCCKLDNTDIFNCASEHTIDYLRGFIIETNDNELVFEKILL